MNYHSAARARIARPTLAAILVVLIAAIGAYADTSFNNPTGGGGGSYTLPATVPYQSLNPQSNGAVATLSGSDTVDCGKGFQTLTLPASTTSTTEALAVSCTASVVTDWSWWICQNATGAGGVVLTISGSGLTTYTDNSQQALNTLINSPVQCDRWWFEYSPGSNEIHYGQSASGQHN